ncbi:DNA adenine methylase [Azospirillum sp. ST 5-10]|uniref:DNA adenine methylase n=1 Tax=unclassified Azospirillum TaxID=2630922 RepID=UPI003F4A68BE
MRAPEALPERAAAYPELRYMGSKRRLLPWLHGVLAGLPFDSALDPFAGSGCVAYLMKAMGKRVVASDFLNVAATIAEATVENARCRLGAKALARLTAPAPGADDFIERTFTGIFFTPDDLRFLDRVSANLARLAHPHEQALARAALVRSCLKKQPRGVFTVSGDLSHYDDGRRDLRLSLAEHFAEQVAAFDAVVFDNGRENVALCGDVFAAEAGADLVYLDPPYVPRADDNCYIKRYHFIEGLSCYWRGLRILEGTKVRKIEKRYTPFSYRRTALDAFDRMFARFRDSIVVLSYGSNGFPDRDRLVELLGRYKSRVQVHARPHRYHFGTHDAVRRAEVQEYLIVGT